MCAQWLLGESCWAEGLGEMTFEIPCDSETLLRSSLGLFVKVSVGAKGAAVDGVTRKQVA